MLYHTGLIDEKKLIINVSGLILFVSMAKQQCLAFLESQPGYVIGSNGEPNRSAGGIQHSCEQ